LAKGRHLDVLVVPESCTSIRSFRVSRLVLSVFCFAALLVVSGVSLSIKLSLDATRLRGRASKLENENNALRRKLHDLSQLVGDLRASLEENVQFEKKARLMAGLDPISEEERLMGVGGPDIGVPDDVSVLDEATTRSVESYWGRLDEMKRQAEFQKRSYGEILDQMASQKEVLEHTPSIRPVSEGYVTSGFGTRPDPFTGATSFHQGIDVCTAQGTTVRATAAGRVIFAGLDGEYGQTLQIDHGRGIQTRYSHNQKLLVNVGQRVSRGQSIALVGTSGRSTGPHVHYEVRVNDSPVNPLRYILPDDIIVD